MIGLHHDLKIKVKVLLALYLSLIMIIPLIKFKDSRKPSITIRGICPGSQSYTETGQQ